MNLRFLVTGLPALAFVSVLGGCSGAGQPAALVPRDLVVTLVGHEGFLLRSGGASVLIDGFIGARETDRDSLMRRTVDDIVAGRTPFDVVTAALVSHPHVDHFDPMIAGQFLESHPRTLLAAIPDVREALEAGFPRFAGVRSQVVSVNWDARGRYTRTLNGVRVDFFRFGHEASQFYALSVSLHVVHMNRFSILHAADPEMLPRHLAALDLRREKIDVAFLPYSFLAAPGAGRMFAEQVGARQVVAMHMPSAGIEQAKAVVRQQFPDAIFLLTPMESRVL